MLFSNMNYFGEFFFFHKKLILDKAQLGVAANKFFF